MPEFGSHLITAEEYHWIRLSSIPLHCWNSDSIVAMMHPLGDLIYIQKRKEASLKYLRVMARLKIAISFPMEIIVDVGVQSFKVLLKDSGIPILRSKIIQVPVSQQSLKPKVTTRQDAFV